MATSVLIAHSALAPQAQTVLAVLIERGSITAHEAMHMRPACYRLAARIAEIREAFGAAAVVTVMESHGEGEHARYFWSASRAHNQQEMFA